MKTRAICITIGLCLAWNSTANAGKNRPTLEQWQLDLIYNPGESMLEREAAGLVFIYDGLLESTVEQILDEKFDRIEHMVFTRVKKTDPTGDELVFDDGCD